MIVWIFQTGEPVPGDIDISNPMRCINLASTLIDRGHDVVVWTAAFSHQSRDFRAISENPRVINDRLTILYTPSTGYQSSIGLARLLDHLVLGLRCYRLLKKGRVPMPDVAFVGFPPIEFAFAAAVYLKSMNVPYVIDPKDMWPEFFSERAPSPFRALVRVCFLPMKFMRDFVFRNAESISTISDGFLRWALSAAGRNERVHDGVFPLTSSIGALTGGGVKLAHVLTPADAERIGDGPMFLYAGSLTNVLDIQGLRTAARLLLSDHRSARLVVCGDGPASAEFAEMASELPNVVVLGRVQRDVIAVLLSRAVASLIPYRNYQSMAAGVPNKFYDALAAGVPVISCLSGDVTHLIESESVGVCYAEGDGRSLRHCVNTYLRDPELRDQHARNAVNLFVSRFEFGGVYRRLATVLEEVGQSV